MLSFLEKDEILKRSSIFFESVKSRNSIISNNSVDY